MTRAGLFTTPWPGPGNSEGPVDPEMPVPSTASRQVEAGHPPGSNTLLSVMTHAWPGPGDSEGPVETDAKGPSE